MSGVWLTDLVKILKQADVPVKGMRYTRGAYNGESWKRVGWQGQGYRELRGIMWHHDASPEGDSPGALDWCMYYELAPCAAIWVDRKGVWHVYAAGLTNHAGLGSCKLAPANTGNQYFLGIETDHTDGEAWTEPQITSLRKGTAAILKTYGLDPKAGALEFHKSYAPGRKSDPSGLDLGKERNRVAKLMGTSSNRRVRTWLASWFKRTGR